MVTILKAKRLKVALKPMSHYFNAAVSDDTDDDGDGVLDGDEDDDGDGVENDEDSDDDGDGVLDVNDEL